MARRGANPEAQLLAAERQRQVVQLRLRGLSFESIGKQLGGISKQAAHKLCKTALRLIPKPDVEELLKLEVERIADLRSRIWSRLAGRPDPNDPTKMIQPNNEELVALVNQAIRLGRHEALLLGLDPPSKAAVVPAVVGRLISDEDLDRQLARLTPDEQDALMILAAKMQGRWVEPPSIETTATTVAPNGDGGQSNR
jgi:hypothetical protein